VAAFVLRRLFWTIPLVLVVVTIIFFMMRSIGGDPFRHGPLVGFGHPTWAKYSDPKPQAIVDNFNRKYGLDLPWYRQYLNYLEGVATFNLGPSLAWRNRTVNEIIKARAPVSMELGALAFSWAVLAGIPIGLLAALRPRSLADTGARLVATLGLGLPNFLVATLLIYLFAVVLGWLPTSGWHGGWEHKLLPVFTLGLLPLAVVIRLTRAAVLETLTQDYVRAAQAKGLRRRRIVTAHVLRNSLVPVVTAAGPILGYLVTGSFVVEQVFEIPGLGRYFVAAVLARDLPVVMGVCIVLTLAILLANLLVDIVHAMLDPRTRERLA
jgi:oligopeptide transport system permease protein